MAQEISSWMRQSYKKGESASGSGSMKKTTLRMADGGDVTEAEDKAAGMAASSGEKVGFFERLRMGNIDDPSSEAYRRLGAGRGKEDRMEVERIANRAAAARSASEDDAPAAPAMPEAPKMSAADFQRTDKDTTPVAMPAPRARPARNAMRASAGPAPAAPAKASGQSLSQRLGKEYADLENAARRAEDMPDATPEPKRMVRKLADDKRRAYEAAADAEKTGRSVVLKR